MATAAEQYSKMSSLPMEDVLKLIDQLSPEKGSKVLDLGCGTGYLSSILARQVSPGGSVVAVDPDKERIQVAQEQYSSSNLIFLEGSSEDIPTNQYDIVLCNYVLHWIKDKNSVFNNVYQNLKSGGKFAFTTVLEQPSLLLQLCDLMGGAKAELVHAKFAFVPLEFYDRMAKQYGFLVELKDTKPRMHDFPHIKALIHWWFSTTHGAFDPAQIDSAMFEKFMEPFGDKSIEFDAPLAIFIFVKP